MMRKVNFGKCCVSAFLCSALLNLPVRVLAQNSNAPETAIADGANGQNKAAPKPQIVEPKVRVGEVRLDGTVTGLISGTSVTMDVTSFTTPAGKTIEFEKAKSKEIHLRASTDYHERADVTKKLAYKDLKLRRRIAVIGKDGGSGKGIVAREIVLWPERDNDHETLGVVQINAESARLMSSGREALQVRDGLTALRYFLRSAEAAQGRSDIPGQALSLDWAGSAYVELEQLDKALVAYNRAVELWREKGDFANEALSLNNVAMVYGRQNEIGKATEALERAAQLLGTRGEQKQFVLTWTNLAHAYTSAKQNDKAINALTQVLSRVRGQNDKSEEASALSDLAYLYAATGKSDQAQTVLGEALPLLEVAQNKRDKASGFDSIGLAYAYLRQNDKALEYFRRARASYSELNDKAGVENEQRYIDRLEKNGSLDEK